MTTSFEELISLYKHDGGSLSPFSPSYVTRQADHQLYAALKRYEYCYIFNARQMGKSSLSKQVMGQLEQENFVCCSIDLSSICGEESNHQSFYNQIIYEIKKNLSISNANLAYQSWQKNKANLFPHEQFIEFIETVVISSHQAPIIICFDELDSLLTLPFRPDKFLHLIRRFYEKRNPENPSGVERLIFILSGVISPSELISDLNSTPFNIGNLIELQDFKLEECQPLAKGLEAFVEETKTVMKEILKWTGGQPFLTQKLCWLVTQETSPIYSGEEKRKIKKIVLKEIVNNWQFNESPEHLKTISDRILWESRLSLKDYPNPKTEVEPLNEKQTNKPKIPPSTDELLKLYRQILKKGFVRYRLRDRGQRYLLMSGLVRVEKGKVVIKNAIYQEIFNEEWIENQFLEKLGKNKLSKWSLLATTGVITLLILGLRSFSFFEPVEIATYDHFLRQMPEEKPDQRITIIGADEQDIAQNQGIISDQILAKVIRKVTSAGAVGIGIDMARNLPQPPGEKALAQEFLSNEKLIGVCSLENNPKQEIPPHPTLPPHRTAYISVEDDSAYLFPNHTVRRYELSSESSPGKVCQASYTLGLMLSAFYLQDKGISVEVNNQEWVFGSVVAHRLRSHTGGYHHLDERGNQLLLRYRRTPNPNQPVSEMSFLEVLGEEFDPSSVKGKVVLIGNTAVTAEDFHQTPFGRMQGIKIHAHFISQMISSVMDDRALISGLPRGGDSLLIYLLALAGGAIALYFPQKAIRLGILLGSGVIIYLGSGVVFFLGVWLPVVPMLISFGASGLLLWKIGGKFQKTMLD